MIEALSQNALAFRNFFFQTRVMRAVGSCNPSTKILGFPSALPIFVSGAAMACLGHPLGEKNITRGAGHTGIIQMVSSNASLSYAEIAQSRQSLKQPLFFQLYKNKSDIVAERRIREVEALGYKAIFLTVDAVVTSNRERDIRSQWESEDQRHSIHSYHDENSRDDNLEPRSIDILGTSGAMVSSDDRNMTWEKVYQRQRILESEFDSYLVRQSHGFVGSQICQLSSKVIRLLEAGSYLMSTA